MGFEKIVGQEHLKSYMTSAIASDNISHAYIITGEPDSGKKLVAFNFAMAIQCEEPDPEKRPCGVCHSCKMALSGAHPDIYILRQEKPNVVSVDDIRKQIGADIGMQPYHSRHKVYIVGNADKMNQSAQNALLKDLEEPGEHVVIMLLATGQEALLPTICSRCFSMNIRPVSDDLILRKLIEEYGEDRDKLKIATAFARGNVGKAMKLYSSDDFAEMLASARKLVRNVRRMDVNDMVAFISGITGYKDTIDEYLDLLAVWYRDVLVYKATGDPDGLIFTGDDFIEIKKLADITDYSSVEAALDAIDRTKERLRANVNFELALELLLLSFRDCGGR